ncbi:hypothetical protein [Bacillus tuaregi]|uniref:hypothetical protein n=1 Tax=Bacillus tuaregi TaxID=1816695 RepID=UPI0008F970E3|nr:hypothetical protein [Bacillus tuaregi]
MISWYRNQSMIGQAWTGRHVMVVQCQLNPHNVWNVQTSYYAPTEPIKKNCAETLSQHLSIGYKIIDMTFIPPNLVQYLLVLE